MGDQSSLNRESPGNIDVFGAGKALNGYLSAWNTVAGEWSGAGRSLMQVNIELATLASRRAKAYLDLPAQVASCRQPQDFGNIQISFWQTCMKQYAEATRRISRQMAEAQLLTGIDESLSDPDSANVKSTRAQQRDFITFPEPTPEAGASTDASASQSDEAPAAGSRHKAA
jgi:hypothetical protein